MKNKLVSTEYTYVGTGIDFVQNPPSRFSLIQCSRCNSNKLFDDRLFTEQHRFYKLDCMCNIGMKIISLTTKEVMNADSYCDFCKHVTETKDWDCAVCNLSKPIPASLDSY